MPIAAVPRYMGSNFEGASPALRFGMYLKLWGVDSRSGRNLWKTHDVNYRATGRDRKERPFEDENKTSALKAAAALDDCDRELMAAHVHRQQAAFRNVLGGEGLQLLATSVAPFTNGLGNQHPLENGFAFLNPYGLPYLPGSGVKGVVRRAAEELAHNDFSRMSDGPSEWSLPDVWRLFGFDRWPKPQRALARKAWEEWVGGFVVGKAEMDDYLGSVLPRGIDVTDLRKRLNEAENGRQRLHILLDEPALHARGTLEFWDVVPGIAGDRLAVEIMTPHQSHYYTGDRHQGSATPHDSGRPNPISFLTVPPGSEFAFHVSCDLSRLERIAPPLAEEGRWMRLVKAAFEHAFQWLGFGAKTAVGYGTMEPDLRAEIAAREREEREVARRAEEEQERRRIAAEQAEAERRAAEAAARKAEFDALPESRKRLIQVEGLMGDFATSSRVDEGRRNQLKSEANRLAEQAASWSDAGERKEAAELLERLYELVGWHDPGRNRKRREKQISKRREAIARVRRGESGATSR